MAKYSIVVKGTEAQAKQACMLRDVSVVKTHWTGIPAGGKAPFTESDHRTTLVVETNAAVLNGWFCEEQASAIKRITTAVSQGVDLPVGTLLLWSEGADPRQEMAISNQGDSSQPKAPEEKIFKVSFTVKVKTEEEAEKIGMDILTCGANPNGNPDIKVDFKVEQVVPYDDDAPIDVSLPEPING